MHNLIYQPRFVTSRYEAERVCGGPRCRINVRDNLVVSMFVTSRGSGVIIISQYGDAARDVVDPSIVGIRDFRYRYEMGVVRIPKPYTDVVENLITRTLTAMGVESIGERMVIGNSLKIRASVLRVQVDVTYGHRRTGSTVRCFTNREGRCREFILLLADTANSV